MKKFSKLSLICALSLSFVSPIYAQETVETSETVATEEVSSVENTPTYQVTDSSMRPFMTDGAQVVPQVWNAVQNAQAVSQSVDGLIDFNIQWGELNVDVHSEDGIVYEKGTPVFRVITADTLQDADFALFGKVTAPLSVTTYGKVAPQYVTSDTYTYGVVSEGQTVEIFNQYEALKSALLEDSSQRLAPSAENELPAVAAEPLFVQVSEGVYNLASETDVPVESTSAESMASEVTETTEATAAESTVAPTETESTAEPTTTVETTTVAPTEKTYKVVAGDTLHKIAKEFGVSVDAIKQLNQLADDNIFVDQVLKIPTTESPAVTTTQATPTTTVAVSTVTSVEPVTTTVAGKSLPSTGERGGIIATIAAIVLIGFGIYLAMSKRDKQVDDEVE